jgi:hypothetical protein
MAFNLVARLKLQDDFTSKMRKASRSAQLMERVTKRLSGESSRLSSNMNRVSASTDKASRSFKNFKSSTSTGIGSITRFTGAVAGLAAAFGSVVAAKKTFDSTVLAAAQREQSTIMINAMINKKSLSKQYLDLIDRISVKSPIMNSKDMLENSKSFLSVTKDLKQLEKMWNLAERMAAIDPAQGVEGAVYALRELFSGDAVSMVERFELPRKVMNEIKKLPIEKQLAALDKYFNKIGWTTKLVDDMGNSTLGLWRRVNEQFQLVLAKMGEPSLKVLKNFFSNILQKLESGELNRFTEIGAKMIKNILSGLTNGITSIYNWFSAVTNSEEFKQKTTLTGKIAFIFDDLYKKFTQWLDASGQQQINNAAKKIIDVLGTAVESAAPRIAAVVMTVGASVGQALVSGAANYIRNNFWSYITSAIPSAFSAKKFGGKVLGLMFGKGGGGGGKKSKSPSRAAYNPRLVKGYAGGLNYVPYDRFPAFLHRGEMVLPRGEAQEYRKNKGRVGDGVTINVQNMHVRQESDIKKIAYELAKLIERKGAMMA